MGCSPDLQAEEVHNTVLLAEPQGCVWLPWRLGMYWLHQTDAHGALACSDPTFCSHQLYSGVSAAQSGIPEEWAVLHCGVAAPIAAFNPLPLGTSLLLVLFFYL